MSNLQKIVHLNPDSILDLGAWIGEFAKEAHSLWPASRILSIEGNPSCEPYLAATGLPYRIVMLGGALASRMYWRQPGTEIGTGNSLYREKTVFFEGADADSVVTHPLMEIVGDQRFQFIKADLQGAELEVLSVAIPLLDKAEYLMIEVPVAEYNEGAPTESEVHDFLRTQGWRTYEVLEDLVHPIDRHVVQQDRLYTR